MMLMEMVAPNIRNKLIKGIGPENSEISEISRMVINKGMALNKDAKLVSRQLRMLSNAVVSEYPTSLGSFDRNGVQLSNGWYSFFRKLMNRQWNTCRKESEKRAILKEEKGKGPQKVMVVSKNRGVLPSNKRMSILKYDLILINRKVLLPALKQIGPNYLQKKTWCNISLV